MAISMVFICQRWAGTKEPALTSSNILIHEQTHFATKKVGCPLLNCYYVARNKSELKEHNKKVHQDIKPSKKFCLKCHEWFAADSYHKHTKICGIDVEERKNFGCRFCDKVFTSQFNKNQHEQTTHQNTSKKQKLVNCPICNAPCRGENGLQIHITRAHPEKRGSYRF